MPSPHPYQCRRGLTDDCRGTYGLHLDTNERKHEEMRIKVTYNAELKLLVAYTDHGRTSVSRHCEDKPSALFELFFVSDITGREVDRVGPHEYETVCQHCDMPADDELCRSCYAGQEQPDLPEPG